jgi:hypothetical protein
MRTCAPVQSNRLKGSELKCLTEVESFINSEYIQSVQSYSRLQEMELVSSCVVWPQDTNDVSMTVRTLASSYEAESPKIFPDIKCYFLIRSGGRTPDAGSANIQSCVTIDLQSLYQLSFHDTEQVTSVAPGAHWGDIYEKLSERNPTIMGGR